jgi:hypothetical protein
VSAPAAEQRLAPSAVAEASRALSRGAFTFSPRQLLYQLVRAGAWPAPTRAPRAARIAFRRALGAHQVAHGRVPGLLSARAARSAAPPLGAPDLSDYSVRRVLVLDRVETMLVFALNGFHRKIEVALLAHPGDPPHVGFPEHVAQRLELQLKSGLRTAFYTLHDASRRGVRLRERLTQSLVVHGAPRVVDVGLTFAQAFRTGIPVRRGGRPSAPSAVGGGERLEHLDQEEELLLAGGSYAHLEELPPLELLRWAYERISRGPEELGFG